MLASTLLSSLIAASATVQAAPFFASRPPPKALAKRAEPKTWQSHVSDVQIHESCNASQSAYLRNGLDDMKRIAEHAHDRILTLGEQDPLYVKYFGNASSAAASGLYAQIVWGNKPGVLLRCDNPDGNCAELTSAGPWAGHWRGQNATEETVICEPSYANRLHLASLCWDGNEIGVTPASQWLAADLLHRLMHIPSVTYNHVEHAADTYPDVLALAASNSSLAAYNQATFQLYALDAYAQDVAFPPSGCVGAEAHIPTEEDDGHSHSHDAGASSSSSAAPAASATVPAEMTIGNAEASATASAAESCHTHGDGEVHCS
ncbi:putative peptidase family-domain-containing protein [Rhodotorula diobovata]|uniref:Putative peptidase family-domain-containing protein n=1 Tax=Rhodotorula diobovata TaxID=5288 RepID=A0A5C5G4M2_9BASI|nr:putative peptidase family-domain-containing protein [Rhodotorula diobovata]